MDYEINTPLMSYNLYIGLEFLPNPADGQVDRTIKGKIIDIAYDMVLFYWVNRKTNKFEQRYLLSIEEWNESVLNDIYIPYDKKL